MHYRSRRRMRRACAIVAALLACPLTAMGQSGTWNVDADGDWSNSGNWSGGTVADGADNTAFFDPITANRTVTLDSSRTIGNMDFNENSGGGINTYILGSSPSGNILTLDRSSGVPTISTTAYVSVLNSVIIAGNDGLRKDASRFLYLRSANTYTGPTIISQGAIEIRDLSVTNDGSPSPLGQDTSAIIMGDGSTGSGDVYLEFRVDGGNFDRDVHLTSNGTGNAYLGINPAASINTNWNGDILIDRDIRLRGGAVNQSRRLRINGEISGAGDVIIDGGRVDLPGDHPFTGDFRIDGGHLYLSSDVLLGGPSPMGDNNTPVVMGAGSIRVSTGGGTVTIERDVIKNSGTATVGITGATGLAIFSGDFTLNNNINFTGSSGGTTRLSGTITGPGDITITQGGIVQFTGDNSYAGGTDIASNGQVRATQNTSLGTGPITLSSSGGWLGNNGSSVSLDNDLVWNTTSFRFDTNGGADMTLTDDFSVGGTNRQFTITGNGRTIFSGQISGTSQLTFASSGTAMLSGDNTFSGLLRVFDAAGGGTLIVASNNAMGTTAAGTEVENGRTLGFSGGIDYTTAEAVSVVGEGAGNAGAIRNFDGNNSFDGTFTLGGTTRFAVDAGSLTLSQPIGESAASSLRKTGPGELVLQSGNTYTGGTIFSGGTLTVTNPSGQALTDVTLNVAGSTLNVNNTGGTGTGSITGTAAGTVIITNPTGVGADGDVSLTNSLLRVNNTGGTGVNGNVTANGATDVYGIGNITGDLTLNGTSTLNPGNSAGVLDVGGNLTFNSSTNIFNLEILAQPMGYAFDQVLVGGDVDLNSAQLEATLTSPVPHWVRMYIVISQGVNPVGDTFVGYAQGATVTLTPGNFAKISYFGNSDTNEIFGGNDIVLYDFSTAIPEPTTIGLLALGGLMIGQRRRRA